MPDGSQIECTGNGVSQYQNASFTCKQQPTGIWFGATIAWNSTTSLWNLTRKDGTVYAFPYSGKLQSITDRYNNSIVVTRNASLSQCTNPGTKIDSLINGNSTGRYVALCYDGTASWTITKAVDSSATYKVVYGYDSTGTLLTSVTNEKYNGNPQASYGWTNGRITAISSYLSSTSYDTVHMTYDSNGRLTQIWENTSSGTSAVTYNYTTDANGKITAVTADLPDSSHRKLQFDTNHYLTSDTRANGSTNPPAETTTYTRDAATELVTSITEPVTNTVSRTTNFVYDGNNSNITLANLTKVTEAAGSPVAAITNIAWQTSAGFGACPERQPKGRNQLAHRPAEPYLDVWHRFGHRQCDVGDRASANKQRLDRRL